jgi:hypothetical protein
MAVPAQGGLSAVRPPPPPQKFDTDAVQAENLEKKRAGGVDDFMAAVADDVDAQREQMNAVLGRLRAGLDSRKNRPFDPVLMATAAGLLSPTKTGSFGESLGYAAQGAGVASEKEMERMKEDQKLELELAGKQMEFSQQLAGDTLMGRIFRDARGPAGAPAAAGVAPAAGAVPAGSAPASSVATADVAAAQNTPAAAAQVQGAVSGRLPVTDEHIVWANKYAPKMVPVLEKIMTRQLEDAKLQVSKDTLANQIRETEQKTRKITPVGLRTERDITNKEYDQYRAKLKETGGDPAKMNQYYAEQGWLESEQARALSAANANKGTEPLSPADYAKLIASTAKELETQQKIAEQAGLAPGKLKEARDMSAIKIAEDIAIATGKSTVEVKRDLDIAAGKGLIEVQTALDIAKGKLPIAVQEEGEKTTARSRAEASETKATKLLSAAEAAFPNTEIANDMIGYAKSNPKAFGLLAKPGLGNAVMRAMEQGIQANAGTTGFSFSVPASIVAQYRLNQDDIDALNIFASKVGQLQINSRQLNRTPGEGATSDFETKMFGAIYAMPSDSARVIVLKSEALKNQAAFDMARAELWVQKSKKPGYTYNEFMTSDQDYKTLKGQYQDLLKRLREENSDLFSSRAPAALPAASAPPAPAAAAPPAPAAAAAPPPAATPLPATDSSIPPGYIRDPVTKVVRKKKQGE